MISIPPTLWNSLHALQTPVGIVASAGNSIEDSDVHDLRQQLDKIYKTNVSSNVLTDLIVLKLQHRDLPIFSANENGSHFAASVNKLPVTLLVLGDLRSGKLHFDQDLSWQISDQRGGAGIYDQPGAPTHATVQQLLGDLLNRSGNTAVRALVNQGLGGAPAVNARWQQIPQLSHTYLQPLDGPGERFYLGFTTAQDALWTLRQVVANQDTFGQFVTNAMATNIWDQMGVRSQLDGTPYILLVNKIGYLDDPDGNNRHDVGLVYNTKTRQTYAYSMLTTSPYTDSVATARADQSLKDMGDALLGVLHTGAYPSGSTPPHMPPAAHAPAISAGASVEHGRILY